MTLAKVYVYQPMLEMTAAHPRVGLDLFVDDLVISSEGCRDEVIQSLDQAAMAAVDVVDIQGATAAATAARAPRL